MTEPGDEEGFDADGASDAVADFDALDAVDEGARIEGRRDRLARPPQPKT